MKGATVINAIDVLNNMKHIICLFFLSVYSTWAQTAIYIGERFTLPSTIMGGERTIDLYLPPSYNDSSLTPMDYPVVYRA